MNRSLLLKVWVSILLVFLGGWGGYQVWRATQAVDETDAPGPLPTLAAGSLASFTFTDSHGRSFPLQRLEGEVWAVSFFFATCPGFCPAMNGTVFDLRRELADPRVKFVSITVDPTNDTPAVLDEYARRYKADDSWIFLTGNPGEIIRLGQDVFRVQGPNKEAHSGRMIVIDRAGQVRGLIPIASMQSGGAALRDEPGCERFKRLVAQLLDETPAQARQALQAQQAASGGVPVPSPTVTLEPASGDQKGAPR